MSAKRKAPSQSSKGRIKTAKKSSSDGRSTESSATIAAERVFISEEVDAVIISSDEPFPEVLKPHITGNNAQANRAKSTKTPAKPLSAIAARRKAREAAEAEATPTAEPIEPSVEHVEAIAVVNEEVRTQQIDSGPTYNSDELDSEIVDSESTPQLPQKRKKAKRPQSIDEGVMSNFKATPENTLHFEMDNEPCLAIGLKDNESIVFDGKALIAPFYGAVSIMGASLAAVDTPKSLTFFPVFSLRTHALLRITPVDRSQSLIRTSDIVDQLDELNLSLLTKLSNSRSFRSIIVVKSLDFCGIDEIDAIFTVAKGLFKPKHPSPGQLLDRISGFSPVFNLQPGLRAIEIPASWDERINTFFKDAESSKKASVSLVCGAKDIGKSTFARYLVNQILNKHQKLAYLETDIGQSEFSPYGMITLHILDSPILGPPFTHQNLAPKRCHFFGAISPRDNPGYYLGCIQQLVDAWRQENNDAPESDQIPLVINTQGWIKGLGYDLMLDIIRDSAVTDVFAMQNPQLSFPQTFENDVKQGGSTQKQKQKQVNLHYVSSAQKIIPNVKFVAYDLRVLAMVSYLHQDMVHFGKANKLWWNFQSSLVERVPWALDWCKGLNGIWLLWDDVKLSQLLYSLNGSLVALISDDAVGDRSCPAQDTEEGIVLPTYFSPSGHPPPDPSMVSCVGLGLIRAIDPANHTFLMLTPLPASSLKNVTGLVKGDIELPLCCMLDQHHNHGGGVARVPWRQVPYLTEKVVEGLGGNAMQIRRVNRRARK